MIEMMMIATMSMAGIAANANLARKLTMDMNGMSISVIVIAFIDLLCVSDMIFSF